MAIPKVKVNFIWTLIVIVDGGLLMGGGHIF